MGHVQGLDHPGQPGVRQGKSVDKSLPYKTSQRYLKCLQIERFPLPPGEGYGEGIDLIPLIPSFRWGRLYPSPAGRRDRCVPLGLLFNI